VASDERNQIRVIVRSIEGFGASVVKRIVLDCTANLTDPPNEGGTPIDTRWASANWVPKIGGTFDGLAGDVENVSTGAQQTGVAQVATGYQLSQGIVTITNNVPYILKLNAGSSKQAPAGFVQAAILRAIQGAKLGVSPRD